MTDARPVNFLLVDDLEENLLALEALLRARRAGAACKARSGEEALELLLQSTTSRWRCSTCRCRAWTASSWPNSCAATNAPRHVPIIFVTAGSADTQRRFRGYEAGAVDFIQKPIEADILRSKAGVFFDLHQQRLRLASAADQI